MKKYHNEDSGGRIKKDPLEVDQKEEILQEFLEENSIQDQVR